MTARRCAHVGSVLAAAVVLPACELTEVTLANAEDVVIAELVLRAGEPQQYAFLYRTVGTGMATTVPGARIEVRDERGSVMLFEAVAAVNICVDITQGAPEPGTCFRSLPGDVDIRPANTYTLDVTLPGGGRITGRTTVPGAFNVNSPAAPVCSLPPDRTLELRWTQARNAWVYVSEVRLNGLAEALKQRGVELIKDPVRLLGLSISSADTTLIFPTGFGLFERADPLVADALLAIRDGLPPGVIADIVVAATDRNYVNWVRGGNFNPSGLVRVPSVTGDGTGVFGSIVPAARKITTVPNDPAPAC